jgi:hypothetical protein
LTVPVTYDRYWTGSDFIGDFSRAARRKAAVKIDGGDLFARMLEREGVANVFAAPLLLYRRDR